MAVTQQARGGAGKRVGSRGVGRKWIGARGGRRQNFPVAGEMRGLGRQEESSGSPRVWSGDVSVCQGVTKLAHPG